MWPVWRATIPWVQGLLEPEDGPERPQAFLVMSALKDRGGDTPQKPPSSSLPTPTATSLGPAFKLIPKHRKPSEKNNNSFLLQKSHLLGVPVTRWEDVGYLALLLYPCGIVLTPGVLNVPSVSHTLLLTVGPQLSWDNWTGNMPVSPAPACCLGNPFVRSRTFPLETACSPWCVPRPCHPGGHSLE